MPLNLKQVAKALDLSFFRIEQWITRGYFRAPDRPIGQGLPREWDVPEIMRLSLCAKLVDSSLKPDIAGQLTHAPIQAPEDEFFVAYKGWHGVEPVKLYDPEQWYQEIVPAAELVSFVGSPDRETCVVISLDNLEAKVRAALDTLAND